MMGQFHNQYPLKRKADFREWSPNIHYAQISRTKTCSLEERRLYDFELLYVYHGELVTHMDEQRYVIKPGQLIYLPSGLRHRNEVTSVPDAKLLGIHFDYFSELMIVTEPDMIVNEDQIKLDKFAYEAWNDSFPPLSEHRIFTPTHGCVQLMEQLVHEFTLRLPGYELASKALMSSILTQLLRLPFSRAQAHTTQHGDRILQLIDEISAAPELPWTNMHIAGKLNLSVDHTARLFKLITGMPPSEYIQGIRHREARRLLRETDLLIEQIGERVGYPDIHHFSRIFRKQEGISATAYRKLAKVL